MISLHSPVAQHLQNSIVNDVNTENTPILSTVQTNVSVSKQELHSKIILNIQTEEEVITNPLQLKKAKTVSRQGFGLVLTDLIYLLKKIEQDAIKFSSDGMKASKISVDRRAEAMKKEGMINCTAQIAGAVVNIAVSATALLGMRNKSNKDSSTKNSIDDATQAKLDKLDNTNKQKVGDINNKYVTDVSRLDKKYTDINKSDKSDIAKLETEVGTLQRHNKKAREAGYGDVDNNAINTKQKQIDIAKNNIANNDKSKDASIKALETERDAKLNKVNAEYEADKDKLLSKNPNDIEMENHRKNSHRLEKYRLIGNLGNPAGQIVTAIGIPFATEQRIKSTLAEQESSVDNKTTDNNRDRSNNYRSTAVELINSIKTILQDRTNTASEIIRRC